MLPLQFELLARFTIALLREETGGVLNAHCVIIRI